MSLRDCATLPRAFIPMLSLLVVACQCVWAESAEEIIARCVEREGRLTSGRLDIAIAIREKGGTPGADQKLRFEWQLPDQCRIASLDDPSRTILLFDGERCATRDGTVWSREFLADGIARRDVQHNTRAHTRVGIQEVLRTDQLLGVRPTAE